MSSSTRSKTTIISASAQCKSYTDSYRNCLKDCRDSGRSKTSSKTCKPLAIKLDNCREEWRRKYDIINNHPSALPSPSPSLSSPKPKPTIIKSNNNNNNANNANANANAISTMKKNKSTKSKDSDNDGFDGTRILPNPICRPLSCNVQSCIKWRQGDQTKCKKEINALKECMKNPETKDIIIKPTEGDKIWTV